MNLKEFRAAYAKNDNEWWKLSTGDMQNLFDEACEELDAKDKRIAELEKQVEELSKTCSELELGLNQ